MMLDLLDILYYTQVMVLIIAFLYFIQLAASKLAYVATVFRHGARYPLGDIYDGGQTKQFHGILTTVGMRQQFLLGQYLKADYIDKQKLINQTLYQKQVEAFTDSSERCVQSLISHLAGLFPAGTGARLPQNIDESYLNPPFEKLQFPENLRIEQDLIQKSKEFQAQFALKEGFQPIPYINSSRFFPNCPFEDYLIARRIQSLAVKLAEFEALHALFVEKMRIIFNLSAVYANVGGLAELFDVVICDLNLGRKMPAQFSQQDFRHLKYVQNYLFALLYAGQLAPIFSTTVVSAILNNMHNVVRNQKEVKKYSIYSGHDTNVVPLINFLNLTTPDCITKKYRNQTVNGNCAQVPPFASNLIFQLHQNETDSSKHFVKLRYNGQYYNVCQQNKKQCQFSQFEQRLKRQFVNVEKQCGIRSGRQSNLEKRDMIKVVQE